MAQRKMQREAPAGNGGRVDLSSSSVERQIVDFLEERTDGAALMLALYGDPVSEPLPRGLAELLKQWRCC
jgi:hypothetical protein